VVVVVSPQHAEKIQNAVHAYFPGEWSQIHWAIQHVARGTGDAAQVGIAALNAQVERVLLLYGDTPLLTSSTLHALQASTAPLALGVAYADNPYGYGRIVRDRAGGAILRIVEEKDASPTEKSINEINVGVYAGYREVMKSMLSVLKPNNQQQELYLTDIVESTAIQYPNGVEAVVLKDIMEMHGINTPVQLAEAENYLLRKIRERHMQQGVKMMAPESIWIGSDVHIAEDVLLFPGVQLYGKTTIAQGCRIEGPSVLSNVHVEAGVHIGAFSHLQDCVIRAQARVGPFARIRVGSDVGPRAHVGNFVELKKTIMQEGSKANHLSYLGDSSIGENSNIGAGVITCNYDGLEKHHTSIGKGCFIGSHATLVAPLEIANGAFVAAGSTITEAVPEKTLAFGRARQVNLADRAPDLSQKKRD
jgi:bifunctional UDP-N-acetylglucosamine pyrophosphorylase/glucosamine-1-phosphate N-acetyltransferase